ncbi:MAG: ATP phosphoribosyltransferase regulatory subunit [Nitrospira sp.]
MKKHERSLVPSGMATILPHAAQRVRQLETALLGTLTRWGYQEIIPPTFEYLDVLSPGLEPDVIEQCYKFADRATGRMLLLRPDVTAQIARMVAMGMAGSAARHRLCYRTTVFRHAPEHAGREREIFQVGAELIGVDGVSADAEIIALMGSCLAQIGLTSFTVSLGHVGFFKTLLAKSGLSAEGQKRAEQAAARKDLPRLEEICAEEAVSRTLMRAILETPGLYGGIDVLERGRKLAGRDRALRAPLDRLAEVYRLFTASGLKDQLLIDLGEFRGFDYYDGVVFEVFAKGLGCELGGGGRYNHLVGRFGRDLPSTGFAFDMDRLFQAMEAGGNSLTKPATDFFLSAPEQAGNRLFRAAQTLRGAGYGVVQGTLEKAGEEGLRRAAQEGCTLRASVTAVVGLSSLGADQALVLAAPSSTGRKKILIKDLSALL